LLTLALGTFIGLQFRKNAEEGDYDRHSFAGLRTCMGISLLGYLAVYLSQFNPHTFLIFSAFMLILILSSYGQAAFQEHRIGATGEITLAMLFLVGALVGYEENIMAIIITILLSIIASGRSHLYGISDRFTRLEIIETVKFAIIVFLILPLLPNQAIDPWGAINPYNIWLMVILISGISFLGYMASKFFGKDKGILLSGFIGGTVSSIAVTTTMAIENKRKPKLINMYSIAILLASLTMYIRVLIEAVIVNQALLAKLIIPIGSMLFTMTILTLYMYFKSRDKGKKTPKLKKQVSLETPFSLKPAIKFSLLFVVILLLIKITEQYLGNQGVYLTAIISSLADVDAITLSLSQLSVTNVISDSLAIRAITAAVIGNTFIKIFYVYLFGSRELTKKMLGVFLITAFVGIGSSFLI
jgi:uncharacterized membrane protein (DUF4010 family)